MKYMTFNSSCSYAGLANMLARHGLDTDDRTIALEMGLPYFFAKEGNTFLSGPSLQTAEWFDLYLNPRGFAFREVGVPKSSVHSYLKQHDCAMLGLHQDGGSKHAFVYTGMTDDRFQFLNNKWAHDPTPEILELIQSELEERVDDPCMIATLVSVSPTPAAIREKMENSLAVLKDYRRELLAVCSQVLPIVVLRQKLNPLFRALFLDGITTLSLLGADVLHQKAADAQRLLLNALKSDVPALRLGDHLPPSLINDLIDGYQALIHDALSSH